MQLKKFKYRFSTAVDVTTGARKFLDFLCKIDVFDDKMFYSQVKSFEGGGGDAKI